MPSLETFPAPHPPSRSPSCFFLLCLPGGARAGSGRVALSGLVSVAPGPACTPDSTPAESGSRQSTGTAGTLGPAGSGSGSVFATRVLTLSGSLGSRGDALALGMEQSLFHQHRRGRRRRRRRHGSDVPAWSCSPWRLLWNQRHQSLAHWFCSVLT